MLGLARRWVRVGLVLVPVLFLGVIWLGDERQQEREIEWYQRAATASVTHLTQLLHQAHHELLEGDARHLRQLTSENDVVLLATATLEEHGDAKDVQPATVADKVEKITCPPVAEGWGTVKPVADSHLLGWMAYCLVFRGWHQALLVNLPHLLIEQGLGTTLSGPLVLLFQVPGRDVQAFVCERIEVPKSQWVCSSGENLLGPTMPHLPSVPSKLSIASGTLFASTVPMAGGLLRVGIYVPSRLVGGGFAPVGFSLFFLGAALVAGGVTLYRALARAEQEHALLEADIRRREAELSTRVAEGQWRVLLEGVTQPMLFLREALVVRVNQAAAELLGFDQRADLLGKEFEELVAPEDRERTRQLLPVALASGGAFTTTLVGREGTPRVVELRPWRLESQDEPLVCLSLKDFTALEKAEAQLEKVLSQIPLGVALLDRRGTVLRANASLLKALGLEERDLLGGGLLPFAAVPEWRVVRRALFRAWRGCVERVTARCRLAGGAISPVDLTFAPIPISGKTWAVLLVASPIPPQVTGQGGADALSLVQAVVGHHVHRCSNIVQGLLGKQQGKPRGLRAVDKAISEIGNALQRMGKLFQTPGAHLHPLDLNQFLIEMAGELEALTPGSERILIRPLPAPAWVMGDRDQLASFLQEAVATSVSCLAEGVGAIEVALEQVSPGKLRLGVSDTGEVLEDEEREAQSLPARLVARGMAFLVARTHKGEAGYRERVGFGARVWIDLPSIQPPTSGVETARSLRAGKVLVVEDEQEIRESLARALREQGYETVEAADGREAIARYLEDPEGIALVVLDLVMPEMDGRQVYEVLSKLPSPPAVLLATGYLPTNDPLLANLPSLLKPFKIADFLEAVSRLLKPPGA